MGAENTSNSGFEKLNEMNYGTWKMLMKALLVRKQLWDVVAGIESNPGGSPNSKAAKGFRKRQAEACAEIILHVEVSQLSFIADEDPKVVWDYLESIHQARGMATRLTLRRKFFRMQKPEGPMQLFVAEVRRVAFQLKEIGCEVDDEDIILVLTGGLPSYYNNFVVTLDSTPPENLTVDYVITRLLNEESRQDGASSPNHDIFENVAASVQAVDSARRPKRTLAFITCFGCGKKGHYQANCPTRKTQTTETANVAFSVTETDDDDEW
jgi:hypothetical protein